MQYRNKSNARGSFYPPEGHDWVPTNEVRRASEHNAASDEELYIHRVARFRSQFFELLERHNASDGGFGWAIFRDQQAGDTASEDDREVLILSGPSREDRTRFVLPKIRIITNEQCETADTTTFLTEDISVMPDATSMWYMSGMVIPDDRPECSGAIIKESLAPLFFMTPDNQLAFTSNLQQTTPIIHVKTEVNSTFRRATPFGDGKSMLDKQYALSKAEAVVETILTSVPVHQYDPEG